MKERPILFSRSMVQAIREGRKTMTRRLARNVGSVIDGVPYTPIGKGTVDADTRGAPLVCPYGVPGDRLWVRETWHPCDGGAIFAADYAEDMSGKREAGVQRWYPGIHLRRVDARTLLDVTAVRVERLRAITLADIEAEGVTVPPVNYSVPDDPRALDAERAAHGARLFADLWNRINGERAPWASNPWVWAVSFRRLP